MKSTTSKKAFLGTGRTKDRLSQKLKEKFEVIGILVKQNVADADWLIASNAIITSTAIDTAPTQNSPVVVVETDTDLLVMIQRLVEKSEVEILDGCAILRVINWPNQGTVADFVNGFTRNVIKRVASHDTNLIFDRYFDLKVERGQLELVTKRADDTNCSYILHCHPRRLSLQ